LYEDETDADKVYVKDVTIDTDFELLFPDNYVNNIAERLNLYTQLNGLKTQEALEVFKTQLIDRFGELPEQVTDLLNSVQIKWLAIAIGFEKIIMKQNKLIGYFINDQQSSFYQSTTFTKVLQFVQKHPNVCKMKEKQTRAGLRLLLTFDNITSVQKALNALQPIVA
jgi:transcription-repair coupling factor (superfamily II helicase)